MTSGSGGETSLLVEKLTRGGIAGMFARTIVAPIDRTKILVQTSAVLQGKSLTLADVLTRIRSEGGFRAFWRGNGANCVRIFPHTATQFTVFESLKSRDFTSSPVGNRLLSGAFAGAAAATLTHPLDVTRIRLQTEGSTSTLRKAASHVFREAGFRSFYKGYAPTLISICPYISINFATFETLRVARQERLGL